MPDSSTDADADSPLTFRAIEGHRIAVRLRPGDSPTLLFLPGYASDMAGAKALALDRLAATRGLAMLRFDYSGTGESGGSFGEGTLERWLGEALALADSVEGPLLPIGSSMGGWIALHVALQRPRRVVGLVGIAAAPDFTDWGYSDAHKALLDSGETLERPNPYGGEPQRTFAGFWRAGQALRLLDREIAIDCPVRLVHGDCDGDVPIAIAERLMARLRSRDVQLLAIKNGGHRLSEPNEIDAILRVVSGLLEPAP